MNINIIIALIFLFICNFFKTSDFFEGFFLTLSFLLAIDIFRILKAKSKTKKFSVFYILGSFLLLGTWILFKRNEIVYQNMEYLQFLYSSLGLFILYPYLFASSLNKVKFSYLLGLVLYTLSILPIINNLVVNIVTFISIILITYSFKEEKLLHLKETTKSKEELLSL